MNRKLVWALALVMIAALAVFGCKKKEESYTDTSSTSLSATDTSATTSTTDTSATMGTTGTTATAVSTLSTSDKETMMKFAQGGMAEVKLGSMAAQDGQSADVKNFGNRMVNDHGKANDELK